MSCKNSKGKASCLGRPPEVALTVIGGGADIMLRKADGGEVDTFKSTEPDSANGKSMSR